VQRGRKALALDVDLGRKLGLGPAGDFFDGRTPLAGFGPLGDLPAAAGRALGLLQPVEARQHHRSFDGVELLDEIADRPAGNHRHPAVGHRQV